MVSAFSASKGPLIGATLIPSRSSIERKMLAHEKDINSEKSAFWQDYNINYPLAPMHYIIDLGSNQYMKAIIVSVQVQIIDYDSIGYNIKVSTDKLSTIEALTAKQFIDYLYSKSQKISESERHLKIKSLIKQLDKNWQKQRAASVKKTIKKSQKTKPVSQDDGADDEDVPVDENDDIVAASDDEIMGEMPNVNVDPEDGTIIHTPSESANINNELNMTVIDCVDEKNEQSKNILMMNKSDVQQPKINISAEYLNNLQNLNTVDDNYIFDDLIPDEQLIEESSELIAKFQYQELDVFSANNWTMLKYLGEDGKIKRKFMSRTTGENIRSFAVDSFMRTSLQNKLWEVDNAEQLEKYNQFKNDPNVNLIVTDTDEQFIDQIFEKQKKIKQAESKQNEEEDEDDEMKSDEDDDDDTAQSTKSKKKSEKKKTVEIVFNNELATCVTTDKGLIYYITII